MSRFDWNGIDWKINDLCEHLLKRDDPKLRALGRKLIPFQKALEAIHHADDQWSDLDAEDYKLIDAAMGKDKAELLALAEIVDRAEKLRDDLIKQIEIAKCAT